MTEPLFEAHHDELRDVVRRFVAERASTTHVRAAIGSDGGLDLDAWRQAAQGLGLTAIGIPEHYQGAGGDLRDSAVVLEEFGRTLALAPYLTSAGLSARLLARGSDEDVKVEWLPQLAAGSVRATFAQDSVAAFAARRVGQQWVVSGGQSFVPDGHGAELLLLLAAGAERIGLFAVDLRADGVERRAMQGIDRTRGLGAIRLDGVPAHPLAWELEAQLLVDQSLNEARVLLAAEQVGGAHACLDLAVGYAKVREQFGRPIGSFQAIKHICADMLVQVESARSTMHGALQAHRPGQSDAATASAVAAVCGSRAFTAVAKATIQVLGGIGFTDEHDAHLYLKRAKLDERLLGTTAERLRHLVPSALRGAA